MSTSESSLIAYEILGLPTFATDEEIVNKYRVLASEWYPERHNNCSFAIEQFGLINQAAACLLQPGDSVPFDDSMKLLDMYRLFQTLFFGSNGSNSEYDDDDDDLSLPSAYTVDDVSGDERDEHEAAEIANKLILEEEEEKLKAERKRAKKKRRKEKKKQQKSETESTQKQEPSTKQVTKSTSTSIVNSKSPAEPPSLIKSSSATKSTSKSKEKGKVKEWAKEEKNSDSDEGIDPNSAFVAVIAKKQKKLKNMEAKLESTVINTSLANEVLKEDPASSVLKSRQLALKANTLAGSGHYQEAINLFSDSIKLDPSDHRFYGNRSYCYDQLNQFEKALKDAEKSIGLCPSWPKGYYRKGRALLGLKRYAAAEECFVKVMRLDNDCEDAITELHNVKLLQIVAAGFTKDQAECALARYSSVAESIQNLMTSRLAIMRTEVKPQETELFISDDESDGFWSQPPPRMQNLQQSNLPPRQQAQSQPSQYDIKMDHNNPENHNSLWIGNVQPDVTEKELTTLFAKYGELLSVKTMPEKFCAFINYKNKNAPGKAMKALQDKELHGAQLVIRFPNIPGEPVSKKKAGSVSEALAKVTEECYFWRTTGCIYGENCRNPHIKEHKGIDKKKWHIAH